MLKSTLLKATKAGGAILQEYFNREFQVSNKEGINNLVTEADHASEKAIIDTIREEFPDHYILSEEVGRTQNGQRVQMDHRSYRRHHQLCAWHPALLRIYRTGAEGPDDHGRRVQSFHEGIFLCRARQGRIPERP